MAVLDSRRGVTLMELMMAVGMMGVLTVSAINIYRLQLTSWNEGYVRSSICSGLSQSLELAVDALRQAQSITDLTDSSVTFMADLGDGSKAYRLYLYHAGDPEPNPPYTQNIYSLRLAQGTVNYGDGAVLSADIAQPAGPVFSMANKVITIDLMASRDDEQMRMRTNVRPRNL